MARQNHSLWSLLLSLICTLLISSQSAGAASKDDGRKEYIVYMGSKPEGDFSAAAVHTDMLQQVFGSEMASSSLVYSYGRSFNGFVAKLTEEEMEKMAAMDGVISVFPNGKKMLHTTKSWDFIGFPQQVKRSSIESDVIIGVFDSGIWPESDSFNDEGFGPPPSKWKGTCQGLSNFTCNNKIIGARYYRSSGIFSEEDLQSPRDSGGHGTHTASTAAGGLVNSASLMGFASGTARGGVPSARIAVYKICWSTCDDADILAAFEDAIADGVDIISLSLGGQSPSDYFKDAIAIGAFHAMQNGILSSASAGNDGPNFATISNFAPWFLSVAATTIDRKFSTEVRLGNSEIYEGVSINTFELNGMYPIIYGGDAPNTTGGFSGKTSRFCTPNSLDPSLVKGKIVLCDNTPGIGAFLAGAVGIVMVDRMPKDKADFFLLPTSRLGAEDGSRIAHYISSTSNATASIMRSSEVNDPLAPYVASLSSRGPNPITLDILKPDLAAPGIHILAAWPPISPVSGVKGFDSRFVSYNIQSGTSMACPHATGAAAYVKSFHPTWSPAALMSALMTTATPMSAEKNPQAEFAYGAGNINPVKAVNPGLVYDASEIDYVKFLCGQGYSNRTLMLLTRDKSICSEANSGTASDLNYPSFALPGFSKRLLRGRFRRTVTNVGSPVSTYKATVTGVPEGIEIQVEPTILRFTSMGQKLSFVLRIDGETDRIIVSASLVWDDGVHQVRSPIVVFF